MDFFRVGVVCDVLNKVSTSECSTIEDRAEVLSEFLERSGYSFPYNVDADSAFAEAGMRCDEGHTCLSFPAVYFSCFKRFVAHIFLNGGKVPEPIQAPADGSESNLDDVHRDPLLLRAVAQGAKSHILSHGCHGFYAPVEFQRPLYDGDGEVYGGWVGSCQSLIEELCTPELTVALDIEMTSRIGRVRRTSCGFDLAESTVDQLKLSTQGKDSHPFWIERAIWFVLYEAARFSIECNSAVIMFPGEKHGPLDAGTIAAEAKENTEGAIPQEGK